MPNPDNAAADRESSSNQYQNRSNEPTENGTVANQEQSVIDTPKASRDPQKQHRDGYDKANLIILCLTFVAAIAAATFTGGQLREMQKVYAPIKESANAAKDSADVASKTLIATQRPWIYPEVRIGSGLVLNDEGAKITFRYILKNSGNTPAINVEVHPKFFAFQFGKVSGAPPNFVVEIPQTDAASELIKLCNDTAAVSEATAKINWLSGDPVFPGRDLENGVTITIPKPEIDSARAQSAYKSLIPVLLFCVTYRFPFDTKSHHTGLIFQLYRKDAASAGGAREFSVTDSIVPQDQLVLMPNPFRSGIAN